MRERIRSQGLLSRTVLTGIALNRRDFAHREARCPDCNLPLDSARDVDEVIREVGETRPVGARVTHRRCGSSFQVRLED